LAFSCENCHFVNILGERFCGACGFSLSSQSVSSSSIDLPTGPHPSPSPPKKNASFTSQTIQEFLNIQKSSPDKNSPAKDEKKQISQNDIERLIHEGQNKEGKS
jgi:hypothetical protein